MGHVQNISCLLTQKKRLIPKKTTNFINLLHLNIIMECDYCGNQIEPAKHRHYTGGKFDIVKEIVPLPFTCRRCGGTFCADHRLPEFHDCISLLKSSKFYISAELKNEIAENQVIDIPLYENLTPDEFKQYIAKKSSEMDKDIVEHKETDYPLYEYQTPDDFNHYITENSIEVNQEIGQDMEKTVEQNTNAIRCDLCGENITNGENKTERCHTGGTKDYYYNKPVQLLFECHRCNGTFCVDHRLPESHFCTGPYSKHTRYSIDKKTKILIAIMIALIIALYIILFAY